MSTVRNSAGAAHDARSRNDTIRTALRYAAVATLLVSAIVHGVLAPSYGASLSEFTLGTAFVVQAVLTAVIAGWLLLRDQALPWLAGAAVMAGTLGALLMAHTESGLPALGPLPSLQEQSYDTAQLVTLAAEAAYLVLAAARLALRRQPDSARSD
jgi:hypothetical protein